MKMMSERDLKERAARLGCKVRRRGNEFHLTVDGGGCASSDFSVINEWLDVIEHKIPLQICTAGQAGAPLVDVLDPLNEGGEPIDGLAGKLRDLRERWDNRLVLERSSLAELYVNGRLEIVLHGDWYFGVEQYIWACRWKADGAVIEGNPSDLCIDRADIHDGDDGNKVVMFAVSVEGVKVPKMLVRSVFRTYFFKKEFCKTGGGLLYRRETGMGYEVFPFRDWKVERPQRALAPGIHNSNGGVVECLPDIVEGIPNDASKRFWNILFGPEGYAVACRIKVDDRRAFLLPRIGEFVQAPIQRGAPSPEFINVAVGPLNL
jgi:hypothetical protein